MKYSAVFLMLVLIFFGQRSLSQCKTYRLSTKGDTINCTDFQDRKQGYWLIDKSQNYGEPGYKEEGRFVDNKREGAWIRYNLMGDIIAEENYKWGYKNGICRYYNLIGIIREESWKATNPENPYDTVKVYHLDNPDKYDLRVMKVEASTVKHGTWNYYDPERQTITRSEEYVIDQLVTNKKPTVIAKDSSNAASNNPADSLAAANKNKPPEVLQYEKKNANKKKIKVRDGATGVD